MKNERLQDLLSGLASGEYTMIEDSITNREVDDGRTETQFNFVVSVPTPTKETAHGE